MSSQARIYQAMLDRHWAKFKQMAFLVGPRQVGKTTLARAPGSAYLNYDDLDHRRLLVKGGSALASHLQALRQAGQPLTVIFDELHKHRAWKRLLKGFFDVHGHGLRLIVTGSAKLDIYRRGGDSLMGRYFLYHMHPFSVAELLHPSTLPASGELVRPPNRLPEVEFQALWRQGGFPDPFLGRDDEGSLAWRKHRRIQLMREDLRDLLQVEELGQIELLAQLLAERSAQALSYSNLAGDVGASVDTIRRWVGVLEQLHWGYLLRPWHQRLARTLRKEPKWHLRDWSEVPDEGQRAETFIAAHLLKAVDAWNDLGKGDFELRYLRDTARREVDLLIVRDKKPWLLVEVKKSDLSLSPWLAHFQRLTGAPHALQVVVDMPYVDLDCFNEENPVCVPARTLLSQLI